MDNLEKVRAMELAQPEIQCDQFLFESSSASPHNRRPSTYDPGRPSGHGQELQELEVLGGLLLMLLLKTVDFLFDLLHEHYGGHYFGSGWDEYVPHVSGCVPFGLLTVAICVLLMLRRRTYGMLLANLWVHDKTLTLVPANKRKLSFETGPSRVGKVTLSYGAFSYDKPSIRLEDTKGNRYSIIQLADISDAGPFAEYCQRLGIRFERNRRSRAWQLTIFGFFLTVFLLFVCSSKHEHPIEGMAKMIIVGVGSFALYSVKHRKTE